MHQLKSSGLGHRSSFNSLKIPILITNFFVACLVGGAFLLPYSLSNGQTVDTNKSGELEVTAFEGASPESGVIVSGDGRSCTTNSGGFCSLVVSAGTHKFKFERILLGSTRSLVRYKSIRIDAAVSTLAIVNIDEGELLVNIDQPSQDTQLSSTAREAAGETDLKRGILKGVVVSSETSLPVSGAEIFVNGYPLNASSDENGVFELKLPDGASISIIHPNFSTLSTKAITISPTSAIEKIYKLSPAAISLQEFVVTAPHLKGSISSLLDEKKESREVAEVLGSEQMSKSGDSDAASALGRVTGLTLVDGKYIFIRGLDERYTAVLLNESKLPSPDPSKRVIPLDLVPTGILESVVIQKSMSPNRTADFGGGIISLRTKSYPDEFTSKVGVSVDLGSSVVSSVKSYEGGDDDWTGLDDGTRKLPENVDATSSKGLINSTNFSGSEIEAFGESFTGFWDTKTKKVSRPYSLSLQLGDSFGGSDLKYGYYTAVIYGDKYSNEKRQLNRYTASDGKLGSIEKELDYDIDQRSIKLGALASLGLDYKKKHSLKMTSILTRKTSDDVQIKEGSSGSGDDYFESTKLKWVERKLEFNQLKGTHSVFKHIDFGWNLSQSLAQRYEPDTREYTYESSDRNAERRLSTRASGNGRLFSILKDDVEDYSVDVTFKLTEFDSFTSKFVIGLNQYTKERTSKTKRYYFTGYNTLDLSANVGSLFTPENIREGLVTLEEGTLNTDSYTGRQMIDTYYGLLDLSVYNKVFIQVGTRVEANNQQVVSFDKDAVEKVPVKAEVDNSDALRSLNASYKIGRKNQIRLGLSETVARPEFRELANATFFDDNIDRKVRGYPFLKRSIIENYDLRWEFYPTVNESLSFGLFYKKVNDPIEKVLAKEGADSVVVSFRNSKGAENKGLELEWLLKNSLFPLGAKHAVSFGGNYSRVLSETEIDVSDLAGASPVTSLERPMQGVSPYSFNSYLSYDYYPRGLVVTLLYNEIGERISEIGISGVPDVYEEKSGSLDAVASLKVGRTNLSLKKKNWIPQDRTTTQDGKTITREKTDTTYSLGVSMSL